MTIRNRLLVLLLAIALTPLIVTSVLQQVSNWMARSRLSSATRETLEKAAQQTLQEQLYSHVEILERERRLTDALLRRQVREVELRLAPLTGFPNATSRVWGPTPPPASAELPGRMDRPRLPPDPNRPGRRDDSAPRPRPEFGERGGRPEPFERRRPRFMPAVEMALIDYQFGLDPNLANPSTPHHPYLSEPLDPNAQRPAVNYRAQSCFVVRDSNETWTKPALEALATLTPVYEETCMHGPRGILWLHTSLEIGVHTTYPGGVGPREPSRYDPRRAEWYHRAQLAFAAARGQLPSGPPPEPGPGPRSGPGGPPPGAGRSDPRKAQAYFRVRVGAEATQGAPSLDPFTDQVVVVRSTPVRYADGSFAGVTALARTIPEIFASMRLPERWGTGIERMLVLVDPNAPSGPGVQVLLHDGLGQDRGPRRSRRLGSMAGLRSQDTRVLGGVVDDVVKGVAGVRKMEYQGKMCLWAYQPLDIPQVAALLIVPYDRVVELAQTMEQSLLKESLFWLQGTTMILLAAGVGAVVLAALKARNLTNPIHSLIEAGKKLGNGDYDARVEIGTGDELEHLGRVFNETGPKLRDLQRMKQSLGLAAAIQHSLLPEQTPALEHFDVAGRCVYCDETGGDYYDFVAFDHEGRRTLALIVGDVSGHGIGAALVMAATRGMLHVEAPHCRSDVGELLRRLNRQLAADAKEGTFVTLFCGMLDDRARSVVWASAGHEPALWRHAGTGVVEELANTGLPLGVLNDAAYEQAGPVVLAPGDILIMGTDGICEARDSHDEFFGTERLRNLMERGAGLTASQMCDLIIDEVTKFIHPAARTDDVTLIVVKAKEG
ncbi:MAG: SpoIIE family protein phosphatase [Planctomycetes bacterium]|nr:SpoIIE family protein phosphatase [Planctomycetota bacterium]